MNTRRAQTGTRRFPQALAMSAIAALLFAIPTGGSATTISVGDTLINISTPPGFAALTPDMGRLYDFLQKFVAPGNEQFASFIPEATIPAALRGEVPDVPRRFTVQTGKSLIGLSVSQPAFVEIKRGIKTENEEQLKKIQAKLPGLIGKLNDGLHGAYGEDVSIPQIVLLPIHYETDLALAYSAFVKYQVTDSTGSSSTYVGVVTTTYVRVKNKVLFLYCYADGDGLKWSRDTARQWTEEIIAANPQATRSSMTDVIPSALEGIDWDKVGGKAVAGALMGLVFGIIGWARHRRKTSK